MMTVRTAAENEMIPSIVREGKPVKEFEPDFFVVSLGNGQPKADKDYSILKSYDFPVSNRRNPPT
jgi:nuclear protein localization family protein 4